VKKRRSTNRTEPSASASVSEYASASVSEYASASASASAPAGGRKRRYTKKIKRKSRRNRKSRKYYTNRKE
jgi:hypothetical protein